MSIRDLNELTHNGAAAEAIYHATARSMRRDCYKNNYNWQAKVVSPPKPARNQDIYALMDANDNLAEGVVSVTPKFTFRAHIKNQGIPQKCRSPHAFLSDPCELNAAENPERVRQLIENCILITSPEGYGGSVPQVGDTVNIILRPSDDHGMYDLQFGRLDSLADSSVRNMRNHLDAEACQSLQDLFAAAGSAARIGVIPPDPPAAASPPRPLSDATPPQGGVNLADLEAIAGIVSKRRTNLIPAAPANFLVNLRAVLNQSPIQEVRDVVLFINSGYRDPTAQGGAMFNIWNDEGADALNTLYGNRDKIHAVTAGPQTREAVISTVARFAAAGQFFSRHQRSLGLDLRSGHGVMTSLQAFAIYTTAKALGARVIMEPLRCWQDNNGIIDDQISTYERGCNNEHMHMEVPESYRTPSREYFASDNARTSLQFPPEITLV